MVDLMATQEVVVSGIPEGAYGEDLVEYLEASLSDELYKPFAPKWFALERSTPQSCSFVVKPLSFGTPS